MKIAYVDAFSGVSGDMLLGALLDAGVSLERLTQALQELHLPEEIHLNLTQVQKGAMRASQVQVQVPDSRHHRHLSDIEAILSQSTLPEIVLQNSLRVFRLLAEAEGRVHGISPDEVHFHEVGALDAIVDVVGVNLCLHELGIERLYASALPYGQGKITADHGVLPLPAPATLEILAQAHAPFLPVSSPFELVTPTGAALLAALATFEQPSFRLERIGTGAGQRELPWPNILRVWIGSTPPEGDLPLVLMETNIDDMNPQVLGSVITQLLEAGALDVFFTPIYMKKNRPAVQVSLIARKSEEGMLAQLLLRHTTTLGLRVQPIYRYEAQREFHQVETPYGLIPLKVKLLDGKRVFAQPEYEACVQAAQTHQVPVMDVWQAALLAGQSLLNH